MQAKLLSLWNVRYYTLSDGHMSVDIVAADGQEAVAKAKERDDTFDKLESLGFIRELPQARIEPVKAPGFRCPDCGEIKIEETEHCTKCGTFFF